MQQLESNPDALAFSPAAQSERNTRSMRGWWGTTDRCHMAFDKYHSWKLTDYSHCSFGGVRRGNPDPDVGHRIRFFTTRSGSGFGTGNELDDLFFIK
jgi:hypothetical protein